MASDTGGGKMTKAEADIEAEKIFNETRKEDEEIKRKAVAEGLWRTGLDANNYLFKESHKRRCERLQKLAAMIDEE